MEAGGKPCSTASRASRHARQQGSGGNPIEALLPAKLFFCPRALQVVDLRSEKARKRSSEGDELDGGKGKLDDVVQDFGEYEVVPPHAVASWAKGERGRASRQREGDRASRCSLVGEQRPMRVF